MKLKEIIHQLKISSNFIVNEPCGYPEIKDGYVLPDDIREFYSICGGIMCYTQYGGFPIEILKPSNVKLSNIALLGKHYEEDISSSWHLIADALDGNFISVDFEPTRLGRCYESFAYSHAVANNCPMIALSFTELLYSIYKYTGDYFFWLDNPRFIGYGDAYATV